MLLFVVVTCGVYSCSILSAEFMRASIHDMGDADIVILAKAKTRASIYVNVEENDVSA